MSSSEENYDLDDVSGEESSQGYSPVSKKTVSLPQLVFLMIVIHRPAEIRPRLHPNPKLNPSQRPLRSLRQLPRRF